MSKVEHANPIVLSLSKDETRATEYSKAATRGSWNEVWESFDRRQKAKAEAANDGAEAAANAAAGEVGDEGHMFSHAGVAAE